MTIDTTITETFERLLERNPFNWVALCRKNHEFMDRVAQATEHLPSDLPMKDRIYAAATGTSPICPEGNRRTLKNAIEGWKGCGRAGVCKCARDLVSAANARTKQTKREAVIESSQSITITDLGDMETKLRDLIASTPQKQLSMTVAKDPSLMAWIAGKCVDILVEFSKDMKLAEKIYIALNGRSDAICEHGNHKGFNTLDKGYRFCAPDCLCRREEQARKMTEHQAAVSVEERARRQSVQIATFQATYGEDVRNSMHVPGVAEKIKATNNLRYGGDSPFASAEVLEKSVATHFANYGVDYPGQCPETMEKIRATNLERYGVDNTMHLARAAFEAQTGYANPFLMEIYQEKAIQSMIERHGHAKALQNPEILAKMIAEVQAEWGVPTVLMAPAIKEKILETVQTKYNRKFVNQNHISDEAYAILQDSEQFRAMFKTLSLREVSAELGLSYDGTRKYCVRHGVELPRSSYEDALCAFFDGRVEYKRGDRTVIKPLEIDILIPELKLGIEFCGLYWHGERIKDEEKYHAKKLDAVVAAGYRLVTIFEDEWVEKREIVKSRLLNIIGQSERGVGARQTEIKHISSTTALDFCDIYHIQGGKIRGFANYGAYHDNVLVGVMTFSRGRISLGGSSAGPIELLRFATDGRNYPGLASKMFKTFVREAQPTEVISYADRRWSDGGLYETLGFTNLGKTDINYWYVHGNRITREHRFKYRKNKIKDLVLNGAIKSEREIMKELGYYRIWDCGNLKFRWVP